MPVSRLIFDTMVFLATYLSACSAILAATGLVFPPYLSVSERGISLIELPIRYGLHLIGRYYYSQDGVLFNAALGCNVYYVIPELQSVHRFLTSGMFVLIAVFAGILVCGMLHMTLRILHREWKTVCVRPRLAVCAATSSLCMAITCIQEHSAALAFDDTSYRPAAESAVLDLQLRQLLTQVGVLPGPLYVDRGAGPVVAGLPYEKERWYRGLIAGVRTAPAVLILFLLSLLLSIRATPAGIRCCRKCGYLLRGLNSTRCPECGLAFIPLS